MRTVCLLLSLALGPSVGQRSNALIQSLVTRLKSGPRHYSLSPSYTSDRRVEVLPVGSLPLQSDRLDPGAMDSGPAPSITDVITGNIGKFETSGESGEGRPFLGGGEADTVAESSQRHTKRPRRRRPGSPGSRPVKLSRPGGRPPRRNGPRQARPGQQVEQGRLEQIPVEDFFPEQQRRRPPKSGRRGPLSPSLRPQTQAPRKKFQANLRPPRQKPQPPVLNFRPPGLPVPIRAKRKPKSPSTKIPRKGSRPPRGQRPSPASFRPPQKIYSDFEPSFESSNPYNDAPLYLDDPVKKPKRKRRPQQSFKVPGTQDRNPYEDEKPKRKRRPQPSFEGPSSLNRNPYDEKKQKQKRKRRPQASFESPTINDVNPFKDQAPTMKTKRPAGHNGPPTDFNPFNKHQSINKPGPPYETDVTPFSDEEPHIPVASSRPDRPKRQKRPEEYSRPQGFEEESIYNEVASNSKDNPGFFQNVQENFPDIESFGIGWDSQKIRRKRAALRYTPPSRNRRQGRRGPRPPR